MRFHAFIFLVLTCVALPGPAVAQGGSEPRRADWTEWSLDMPHPEMGCEFPDFPLPDTEGNTVWFNDFRGRVILLSFCSCYTDTCCPLIDALEKIRALHSGKIFSIMVCCETAPALARDQFAGVRSQCSEAADLILIDEGFQTEAPFLIAGLPTTYLIDGTFCMRYKARSVADLAHPGFLEALEEALPEAAVP